MIFITTGLVIVLVRKILQHYGYCVKPPNEIEGEANGEPGTNHKAERSSSNVRETIWEFITTFLSTNCINGAGFLALPWAFNQSGVGLSTICLVLVVMLSNLTKTYLVESMECAEKLSTQHSVTDELHKVFSWASFLAVIDESKEEERILSREGGYGAVKTTEDGEYTPTASVILAATQQVGSLARTPDEQRSTRSSLIRRKSSEVIHSISASGLLSAKSRSFDRDYHNISTLKLTKIFLGDSYYIAFCILNTPALYGMLCAFAIVFASSLATLLPIFHESHDGEYSPYSYLFYLLLFSLIALFLLCADPVKCLCFLDTLSFCRILLIFVMIFTSLRHSTYARPLQTHYFHMHHGEVFRFEGLHITLPALLFATLLYCPISGLSQPSRDKTYLRSLFVTSLVIWGFILSFFGIIVAWSYPLNTHHCSNLNWEVFLQPNITHYDEDHEYREETPNDFSILLKVLSAFVLAFPALDAISAFRSKCMALANNLMDFFPCTDIPDDRLRWRKIQFRMIAAIPPLFLSAFFQDLGTIAVYTGIIILLVDFAFPAILYIESKRIAEWNGITLHQFPGFVSSTLWAWVILFFCVVCFFCFVLSFLIKS